MGKKAVVITGGVCILLFSFLVPSLVKYYRIEALVQQLHSTDQETQSEAIDRLAEYGPEVISRLIEEIEQLPKLGEKDAWWLSVSDRSKTNRLIDLNLIKTFLKIGESSIPQLLRRIPSENYRLESIALCVVVFHYSEMVDKVMAGKKSIGMCLVDDDGNPFYHTMTMVDFEPQYVIRITQERGSFTGEPDSSSKVVPKISYVLKCLHKSPSKKEGFTRLPDLNLVSGLKFTNLAPARIVLNEVKLALERINLSKK